MISTFKPGWSKRISGGFLAVLGSFAATASCSHAETVVVAPVPALDTKADGKLQTAYFAGGCFWGVEGVFSHVKGVRSVQSGYAGGPRGRKVDYEQVSTGRTGFAEAVKVVYDPARVSYGTLMRVFFSVITDPTTLNYQGPDHGTQYRSALFPTTDEQERAARSYLAQLGKSGLWNGTIATRVEPFTGFVTAEGHHQNFMANNPRHGYITRWDAPKLAAFKRLYPALYDNRTAP
ncbi:peptide-methionine (S)-S-oxide reductase MsrA [Sphingobium subterraneum]|uniref:Peptide methionine sulfoxide reductase MsrA n=1 Tax=Sphingobium subterraneum TaxID=627688 RepID=A0A841J4P8_9SPHN|nr:peptide-methionine (S)-S-oxide reductase MsrA [Sphingobium subterraneum]MBB6124496.1 peptide-methionine (S)-S-oxide reductase [Sphingobium subterraneum]